MATVDVGREFSLSFWIYLDGSYDQTTRPKLIFQRGNPADQQKVGNWQKSANPIIFMDKSTNRMYVALATSAITTNSNSYDDILATDVNGNYNSGYLVTKIDYVPLQRWVNVLVVVKDSALFVYLDSDMYSAVSVNDMPRNTRPIIQGCTGDAYLGDSRTALGAAVSKMQWFNYALTRNEISNIYSGGPYTQTWLSYLGFGNYGVRSPVYEVGQK
jgi:hypothetical protein